MGSDSNSNALMQLSAFFARKATSLAPPGTAAAHGAAANLEAAQGSIMADAMRKQKERQEKEEKAKKWGGLGGTLGTAAGIAAAPFTFGTSLAATAGLGALGGAAGNAIGQGVSGGTFNPGTVLQSGIQGGVSGLTTALVPKVEGLINGPSVPQAVTNRAATLPTTVTNPTDTVTGIGAVSGPGAPAAASYTNPLQARMHGVTQPTQALAPAATNGGAGQKIAQQLLNYSKAQQFTGALGLGGLSGFNQQERFNPEVPSGIRYMRHPDGSYEEY